MVVIHRAADRFQRALDGEGAAGADVERLVATARALGSLDAPNLAPRAEFVQALRDRLVAEAEALPTPSRAAAHTAASRRAAARTAPVVVVLGRGFPRVLAGATASVIAVGAVVGVASRNALPGSALYPVKGWLDSVAVQMAGSDRERGLTHLSQAQEHISDARTLAEAGDSQVRTLEGTIEAATESVRSGQRDLNASFDATGNPQDLIATRDFAARALPQVEALRTEVPGSLLPDVNELLALLAATEHTSQQRLAACLPTCPSGAPAAGPSTLPTLPSPSAATTSVPGASGTARPPAVTVPSTAVTVPPGGGVTVGPDGATVGGGGGGVTVGPGGATVNGPSVGVSVPSGPSATVPLPSVGVSTGGVGATVPGGTLGGITLPGVGVTLTVPTITLP
jgi:hypothetical protein